MIMIQRGLYSVTVSEIILSEEGINKHLLVDPEFTSFHVALKLDTKEGVKGPEVLDSEDFFDLCFDKGQESHRGAPGHTIINVHC
jgi:hypothetical protein